MEQSVVNPPVLEPVSLDTTKIFLKIVDDNEEDDVIRVLISSARQWVEEFTWRAIIEQTIDFFYDEFPGNGELFIPKPPTTSIVGVFYKDSDGNEQEWSSSEYDAFLPQGPTADHARITPKRGFSFPAANGDKRSVRVRAVCGYGTDPEDVPEAIRTAIMMIVATNHENPQDVVTGTTPVAVPKTSEFILAPFRVFRFQ